MSKYTFYEDPGHGWLRVELKELVILGIDSKISSCSYSDNIHYAYLEEDCDLSVWATAKGFPYPEKREEWKSFWSENVHTEYQENTFIRNLPSYSPFWRKSA